MTEQQHPQNAEIQHLLCEHVKVILRASDGSHIIIITMEAIGVLHISVLFNKGFKPKGVPIVTKLLDGGF